MDKLILKTIYQGDGAKETYTDEMESETVLSEHDTVRFIELFCKKNLDIDLEKHYKGEK